MTQAHGGMSRWRTAATATFARMARSRTGPRHSESVQAQWSTQMFAAFAALVSAGYVAFGVANHGTSFSMIAFLAGPGMIVQLGAGFAASAGQQLFAALVSVSASIAEIVAGVTVLGWRSGLHLYLIATGVVVFVVFTARQAVWRGVFIGVAFVAFFVCQTALGPMGGGSLPERMQASVFSLNAVMTALLVFALSGLSYSRTNQARAESARNARRAEYLANTDELTGLPNRRPLIKRLDSESAPGKGAFSVAIADLDRFKELNDTYGHECGDVVLASVANAMNHHLRLTDVVGRWGGEEFIVVLPDTTVTHALALMERLRTTVSNLRIECNGHTHTVTTSIGVADGTDDALWHKVVKRADDALYDAKTGGRNTVRSRPLEIVSPDAPVKEFSRANRRERP